MSDKHPRTVFGRVLACRVCHERVDLIEIPSPWINKDDYVCGSCLKPVVVEDKNKT